MKAGMRIAAALLVFLWGCHEPETPAGVAVDIRMVGDTVIHTSHGIPPVDTVPDVEVVWQDNRLENPRSLALASDGLLIGDRRGIHFFRIATHEAWTIERVGDGPGEFRSVSSVGAFGPDTLAIYDAGLMRLSYFSVDGEFLGSSRITPVSPYVNPPRDGPPLVLVGSGLLWMRTENVHLERPTRAALLWHDIDADTATVLNEWDDVLWRQVGPGFMGHEHVFPPRVLIAVSPDGRVAMGIMSDYCITVLPLDHQPKKICRDWTRTPPGRGVRSPDPQLVPEDQREVLQALWRVQEVGELLPSFDRIRFSEQGELWVRTVGEELANIHPHILSRRPELGPSHRSWDVFSEEGRLERTILLPAAFDPRVMTSDVVYGFLELPTGEITLARANLPAILEGTRQ